MERAIRQFVVDESGAAAIEYALIAVGIAVAIVVVVTSIGSEVSGIFEDFNTRMAEQQGS